ncbi:MAG: hypothetical protein WBX15_06685 [Thermoanaerobaculia bacterium]
MSINKLRNHIRSIYDKLHVNSNSEAVSRPMRGKIVQVITTT